MTTLTLSGWTQPHDALADLADDSLLFDYSDYPSVQASFEGLKKFKHAERVVAWSMGGQLAVRAIAAGVLRPKHLTLIATPYQFVAARDFKHGMEPLTFERFRENYRSDAARSKERFHGLIAKGDHHAKRILSTLEHHHEVDNTGRWLPWLDALGMYSFAADAMDSFPPTLLIHGENDAIVPHAQSLALGKKIPKATVSLWKNVGHAPHLHDRSRLMQEITAHRRATGTG